MKKLALMTFVNLIWAAVVIMIPKDRSDTVKETTSRMQKS